MTTEEIAIVAYRAQHAYCIAIGESRLTWGEQSDAYRRGAIDNVRFCLENPDVPVPDFDHSANKPFTDVQRTKWLINTTVIAQNAHKWTKE